MACRKHHPFFKLVLKQLPIYHRKYPGDAFRSTGPFFISFMYEEYKSRGKVEFQDDVILTPSSWFLPNFNWKEEGNFRQKCNSQNLTKVQRVVCDHLESKSYKNGVLPDEAFAVHHWAHSYSHYFQNLKQIDIRELIPNITVT